MVRLHPETVKVEDAQWDITVSEPIKEPSDSFLVIVGSKAFRASVYFPQTFPKAKRNHNLLVVNQRL
jgi:hypothetical protein